MKKFFILILTITMIIFYTKNVKNNRYKKSWIKKNIDSFDSLEQFSYNIKNIFKFNKIFYKTDDYNHSDKNFISKKTILDVNPIINLKNTILNILSMSSSYFNLVNLYLSTDSIQIFNKRPYFYDQIIIDNITKSIQLKKNTVNFTDYLINHHLKCQKNNFRMIYSITINLMKQHISRRAVKYINVVRQASQKYGIDESLILAIIQTESSFNPNAVSRSDALGLMQVVQHTAGKDVFQAQGKSGIPSRNYLFNPVNNIDTGTAYLSILNNVYLNSIDNPTSRRYAVIAAYNSGAESVLRIFSENKIHATDVINNMSPHAVYSTLITHHPSLELRRYLYKVNIAQKIYNQNS